MTKQQLKNKISDLKEWLNTNHLEHEARPHNELELKKAQQQLNQLKSHRTIERGTFDLREHNFYPNK